MGIVGATLLDALYLSIHLPSDTTVKYIGFGSPRVRFDQLFIRIAVQHSMPSTGR